MLHTVTRGRPDSVFGAFALIALSTSVYSFSKSFRIFPRITNASWRLRVGSRNRWSSPSASLPPALRKIWVVSFGRWDSWAGTPERVAPSRARRVAFEPEDLERYLDIWSCTELSGRT